MPCLLYGNAQLQTATKIHGYGGGALKRHQKQNRKKLPKSTRNSPQKVSVNGTALSSFQVRVIRELYNLRYPDKENALKEGTLIPIFYVIFTKKKSKNFM